MSTKTVKTVCTLCGLSGCGLEVVVKDGKVVKVQGDRGHPENKGALCVKGRAAIEILYSPDRLKYPLRRVGARGEGKWERISWDDALSIISDRLKTVKTNYGPESVCFMKGSGHDNTVGDVRSYFHRLANLFGTPNLATPFYNCYGPRVLNMFMTLGSIPAPDVENSNCIVLWGINPTDSSLTRQIKIQDAVKRGAKLLVIDPRTTYFAGKADIHLKPRPGTDGALALGMLRVIVEEMLYDVKFVSKWTVGFEELKALLDGYPLETVERITWVPREEIKKAARLYAGTEHACIFLGNALDQHTNASQSIRAIAAMMAITDNLDARGGNIMLPPFRMAKNPIELHERLPPEMDQKRLGRDFLLTRFEFTKLAHEPSVVKAILEETPYPVKAMLVIASNPMRVSPDTGRIKAALEGLDFLVVADIFMSQTAQLADIVLPACTFLEETYIATYEVGAYLKPTIPGLVKLRPAVVPPLNESRTEWQIVADLARKMGYGREFPWRDIHEAIDYELKPTGITVADLQAHPEGIRIPGPSFLYQKFGNKGAPGRLLIGMLNRTMFKKYPRMYYKYKKMGFMTPSKKVELYSKRLHEMGYDALPVYREPFESPLGDPGMAGTYPIVLTTGAKVGCYVHSQMRNVLSLQRLMPRNVVEIHPDTAKGCGIGNGDEVRIETPRSSITCIASVTDKILPQVAQLYHGFDDANANSLTDTKFLDPITGSAPMKSALCRITKV
ncbi:MAG TPA: molybdopterin-dependent oxidoreductase [Methanocella sp.]|nr:molybdopterin-dependent oxidoreductase [Methanocella sp.]